MSDDDPQQLRDELDRARQQAQRGRELVLTLMEMAPAIVLLLDDQGLIVSFNSFMEQLSGYTLDEVRGKDWFATFIPEPERDLIGMAFAKTIDATESHDIVNAIVTRNGSEVAVEWNNKVLVNPDGKTEQVLCIGRPVDGGEDASKRRTEADIDHPVFEYAPIPMILVDRRHVVHRVNRAAAGLAGRAAADLAGIRIGEAISCPRSLEAPGTCGSDSACETCALHRSIHETIETRRGCQRSQASITRSDGRGRRQVNVLVSTIPLTVTGRDMVLVCLEDAN